MSKKTQTLTLIPKEIGKLGIALVPQRENLGILIDAYWERSWWLFIVMRSSGFDPQENFEPLLTVDLQQIHGWDLPVFSQRIDDVANREIKMNIT